MFTLRENMLFCEKWTRSFELESVLICSRWSLNIVKNFAIFRIIDVDIVNVPSSTAKCGCSSRILLVGWHRNGSLAAQDAIVTGASGRLSI
jgi:hypothetical protein